MSTKFGWCMVYGPHVNCPRKYFSRVFRKMRICSCPCHLDNDKTLEELI